MSVYPHKDKDGKVTGWRASPFVKGFARKTKKFATKREATAWHAEQVAAMNAGQVSPGVQRVDKTVADALLKYAAEVSPGKRGERWEKIRLNAMAETLPFRGLRMADVRDAHVNDWIATRTRAGRAPNTILRELGILGQVFKKARRAWKWIGRDPFEDDIRRPRKGAPRKRVATAAEIAAIVGRLGYVEGVAPDTSSAQTAYAYLVSLETGLRTKEALLLEAQNVHLAAGYVRVIDDNKTATERHAVLTPRAVELLAVLVDAAAAAGRARLFTISTAVRDQLFRRAREREGIVGLTYHDSRRAATTALSKSLTLLELQRTTGIKTVQILADTYYADDPAEAAAKLRKPKAE